MRARGFGIALLLQVCWLGVSAQLEVRNFFSITGKKNVPVTVIAQDGNGFLWLGTAEGLYRFDGINTQAISKDFPMLRQEITAVFIDEQQNTWVGTRSGSVYSFVRNKIDSLRFPENEKPDKITSFANLNSTLLIGTYGSGLYTFGTGVLHHYTAANGLSDNVIYRIAGNRNNTAWLGTDAGITELRLQNGKAEFVLVSNKDGLPDNIVRDIVALDDELIVSMQDSGVCRFNRNTRKFEKDQFFSNWTKGTVINTINCGDKLALATEKNGLFIFSKGGMLVYNYDHYLQASVVNQLFIDREKQLWVASRNGISQLSEKRYSFINSAKGLNDDNVLAIAVDNDHGLWLGAGSGISRLVTDDVGHPVISNIRKIDKYTISCAAKAPDGSIWFGTYGNGIIVARPDQPNSMIATGSADMMDKSNISHIFFEGRETVYISTLGGGLIKAKLQPEAAKKINIEKIYTEADGLGSTYVYCAITDAKGRLFVGTDGGGLQTMQNGRFVNLIKRSGLESNTVFSICSDKYNNIWATTNANGIIRYNGKEMTTYGAEKGLRDEQPQQIYSTDNTLFAVSSKGIDKINCETGEVSYYDVFDGDLEPNLNAIFFENDHLYCGTNNGVLVYRTSQQRSDSIRPSVFIRSLQINFKSVPLDSAFEFSHNQNNIQLAFDGIWLKTPGKLNFRYRLHGLEDNWMCSSRGETVSYNNLRPGNYTFIVQVKNEEDVWSDPTGYSFIIKKPLWQHWWFWVAVVIIATVTIFSLVRYRLRALQRENTLLERRVKERTAQIEKQSLIIEKKNEELEQLSLVASKTDNVVAIFDASGKLDYLNESFVKRNKMSLDELKRQHGETLFELSNHPDIRKIVDDAIKSRRSVNYESLNRKVSDGSEVWESSTLTPLFNDDGTLRKIIIIDTDVSERKKQEQIITQKNKDITDSISYARKIQHAILPKDELIRNWLPHSFVLYLTKDIVSGDFYWFSHFDNCSIIAAVDCTGHGVPGAFMSLIGYNLLNKIVNEQKITNPGEILLELNKGVLAALHKNESESKDGMDIAICKINHQTGTMDYAGAMRPLWILRNGDIVEVKADKIPIGTRQTDREAIINYTTHSISVNENDIFYIFTDGYADQFGGPKDKKYSSARFKQLLITASQLSVAEQEQHFKHEHQQWKGVNEQVDDILLIGFSVTR